jgi:C-terminal processing protease CtpA/Prc
MSTGSRIRRLAGCLLAAALIAPPAARAQGADTLSTGAAVEDFDALWSYVRDHYAYFHLKQTDWERVRELYRPRAAQARTRRELLPVLEDVMEELYDPHAHLGVNSASSPRLVPTGADLWAEWRDGRATITAVRPGSAAEAAGLVAGMEVVSVDGRPVRDVVRERLPAALRAPDPAADDWALRAALAGRRNAPVRVEVAAPEGTRTVEFTPGSGATPSGPLSASVLDGDVGYVRIHNALGELALVAAFDSALALLRDTRGLVLDLRDTPSGGNTTVARGLLGRFISEVRPYQAHELPSEAREHGIRRLWVEQVAPRGPFTCEGPVVVLVGRWTASMGEGMTIALDGLGRATAVGTPMAGLLGATYGTTLPRTGWSVRVPAERLYHVNGTPREAFVPSVLVEPGAPGEDPALAAALELLRSAGPGPERPR